MFHRNSIALVGVLFVILMMTGLVIGRTPHASALGVMAPFILPSILTLYFLVVLAYGKRIIEILAAFFLSPKQEQSPKGSSLGAILGYIVVFVALILLARMGALQSVLQEASTVIGIWASSGAQIAHLNQGIKSAPSATMVALSYYTALIFAGIAFLSVALFFGALRLAYKEVHEVSSSGEEVKLEALQVVQQAVNSLRSNTDYEETIVKCYRQMCEVLSGRGFIIRADQTAREFASTVSKKLSLGNDAVRGLTFLFEEARYSAHIIDDDQRKLAVNKLDSLENALSHSAG
jgi:hypothetical protein